MKFNHLAIKSLLILSIALFGYSCAVNPVSGKKEISFMSESQELALGKQSDPGIVANFGLYENPTLQAFINEKGMEMAKISHRPDLPYEFKILDSPVVNAFAVPGGYIYFTRGILAHFTNEAEFAGVLGHEIGHVTARHSAKAYSKQILTQGLFVLGVIVSPAIRELAEPVSQGLALLSLKFSRDNESESDKLGVQYSTAVGYDAHQMANFFFTLNKMRGEGGSSIPTFQSTHPDPLNRYEDVNTRAEKAQAEKPGNYKVNRDSYLKMIDGLVYGEDPRQGYVEDDYFYHPELKFKFPVPRGWQTANSPVQFQMADKGGKAMMLLTTGQEKTLQESAQAFNEKQALKVVQGQNTTVNGIPAYAQVSEQYEQQQQGQQQPQQGQGAAKLRILSYFIQYNNLIYQLHGVTEPANYAAMERTFLYTMQGFNTLNDPAKINRQPDRIKIISVQRAGTLSSVLLSNNMPSEKLPELALINGMDLTDQVASGTLIKLIEYDKKQSSIGNSNTSPNPAPPIIQPKANTPTSQPTNNTPSNTGGGHLPPPPRTNTNNQQPQSQPTQTSPQPTQTNPQSTDGTPKRLPGKIKKKN